MKAIPYGRQDITADDIKAVTEALHSDFMTQGPRIPEFEEAFAQYVGAKYAIAVSNATAALHLSAMAMGVSQGDKVITTPITFAASANCIRYCGGEVVFADIDPQTYLIDIDKVRGLLKSAPKGTYKGIIPVDFGGRTLNMEAWRNLADEFGLWIIEDSCHAPGGYFIDGSGNKQFCGNGKFAELSIFSFHPVKHIATGEGGMITTNDPALFKKLSHLRSHGITRQQDDFVNSAAFARGDNDTTNSIWPGWYMEMQELGYNYRLTDLQAALGTSQLHRAGKGVERRREIASRYAKAFANKTEIKGQSGVIDGHAYHLYIIEAENRLGLYNHLRGKQIFAQIHYIPCHLMPYYRNLGWKQGDMPMAELYYTRCLSLPMYPTLTDAEQDYVIQSVNEFYE